jgi:hypothetical protein
MKLLLTFLKHKQILVPGYQFIFRRLSSNKPQGHHLAPERGLDHFTCVSSATCKIYQDRKKPFCSTLQSGMALSCEMDTGPYPTNNINENLIIPKDSKNVK